VETNLTKGVMSSQTQEDFHHNRIQAIKSLRTLTRMLGYFGLPRLIRSTGESDPYPRVFYGLYLSEAKTAVDNYLCRKGIATATSLGSVRVIKLKPLTI
jgi:hypothetical protein